MSPSLCSPGQTKAFVLGLVDFRMQCNLVLV